MARYIQKLSRGINRLLLGLIVLTVVAQPGHAAAVPFTEMLLDKTRSNQYVPPLDQNLPLGSQPATDAKTAAANPILASPQQDSSRAKSTAEHEDIGKRTEHTKTIINADGRKTKRVSLAEPMHYKKNGQWSDLKPSSAKASDTVNLSVGDIKMAAKPLQQGIQYEYKGKKFSASLEGANNITPKLVKENGTDVLRYDNAFDGIDITYVISGYSIKEAIVVKNKTARTAYKFIYKGITLSEHKTIKGAIALGGLPDSELFIAPLNVMTSKQFVTDPVISQKVNGVDVEITLNAQWLNGVANDALPVTIDPTLKTINKTATDMQAIRSDGYRCGIGVCSPQAGNEEYPGFWAYWRTLLRIPFSEVNTDAVSDISSARLHFVRNGGVSGTEGYTISPAGCWDFNCAIEEPGSLSYADITNDNWMDVTNTINWMYYRGMTDDALMLRVPAEAFQIRDIKTFDLSQMVLEINYFAVQTPPQPNLAYPEDKKVIANQQPILRVDPVNNPDGTPARYNFFLMSSPNDPISVVTTADPFWAVPDGLLKDGVTYYWSASAVFGQNPQLGPIRSFKVDLRKGKDSTQSYDTVGPVSIDQATGNLSTSVSSHKLKALGGDMAVSLDYNTPAASRPGLVAEYWNNETLTGGPQLTTTVPDINFDWKLSTPLPYEQNPTGDHFSARYTGFIAVPTSGLYTFGAGYDDGVRIYVNSTLVYDAWNTGPNGLAYGTPINIFAGSPVSVKVEFREGVGSAVVKLFAKSPMVPGGEIAPRNWFETGVKAVNDNGLTADYYRSTDANGTFPSTAVVSGEETSFNYESKGGLASKVPNGTVPPDLVRYRGLIKAPTTGAYNFSIDHAGGLRLKINNQQIINNWDKNAFHSDSTQISLTAGTTVPIEIEYWAPVMTTARLKMYVEGPSIVRQIVPAQWLILRQDALPSGWQLGVDGNGAGYDRIRINGTSAVLTDSTGSTHEYKWQNDAFIPPANEYGVLTRNTNGTHTFKAEDGKEYIFALDGSLTSMTAPTDDKRPSGLKYVYGGSPARLTRIVDSVNTYRYVELLYDGLNAGSTTCTPPTGFDAPPAGYLCKIKSTDGVETNLRYKAGNLARVEGAGGQLTDYGYDSFRRLTTIRDPLTNDAISAGVKAATDPITYDIAYDSLGHARRVALPEAAAGAGKAIHHFIYLTGATLMKREGLTEPSGYSQRTEYDDSYRTVQVFGVDGKATKTQWHAAKDLVLSTTDPLDLKTTTIYDADDRPSVKYGPAPSTWFGADNIPITTQLANVPKTESRYDESMQGLSASFYDNKQLAREPKGRSFERGNLIRQWTSSNRPVTPTTEGWGIRLTGELILPTIGAYSIKVFSDDGARVYMDNKRYIDDWTDGVGRDHPTATYDNDQVNKRVKFRIDYYDKDQNDIDSKLELRIYKPGGSTETEAVQTASYLAPNFSLTTSETVTDNYLGQVTNSRTYNKPEYGMLDKIALDPTNLNYTSTTTTEAPGAFFRQTSKTLPGGNRTTYQYYTSGDAKDDPCTTTVESAYQAGLPKGKTEPDPDGAGALTSQKSEMIYDQSGQVVAARINNEGWTCNTYDSRGRLTKVVTPSSGSRPGMTSNTNYAVGGNPLKVSSSDTNGTVTTEYDLLGRVVKYTDAYGSATTITYDAYGRVASKANAQLGGTEVFTYDGLDRLTSYTINGVLMANVYYDSFSRIKNIDYPASNIKLVSLEYDSLLRIKATNWKLSDGTTIREDQTKSTTGLVLSNTRTIGTTTLNQSYTYDKAGRLRTANVGTHTMSYGFDAPSASCPSTKNPNAQKNANRTSQTIDGVTTTYCYDFADRLLTSSDANYNNPVYDDRGNIIQIGSTTKPIKFGYDQSNRAIRIEQRDASNNGTITEFIRDAGGRILQRKESKLTNGTAAVTSQVRYSYSTSGDSADIFTDIAGGVQRKVYGLPGGITLTSNLTESTQSKQRTYAIPNFHGDTMVTADYSGLKVGTFTYDPFGNQLDSTTPPQNNSTPGTTKGYLGQYDRMTEAVFSVPVINMGDRIYLPGLGRFMQPDPVEGGNANAYIYPADPVNSVDVDGNFAFLAPLAWFVVSAVVTTVVVWVVGKVIDKVAPPPYRAPAKSAVDVLSYVSPGGAGKNAITKTPVYVPKAVKVVKDVFGGTAFKSSIALGNKQHAIFKETMSLPKESLKVDYGNGKYGFADAITKTDVYELKPYNNRAIRKGMKQLEKYSSSTGLNGQLWVYGEKVGEYKCLYGCTP